MKPFDVKIARITIEDAANEIQSLLKHFEENFEKLFLKIIF